MGGLGVSQGYYANTGAPASGPTNCPTCKLDPTTHAITANWVANSPLDTNTFLTSWLPGVYFIRLTEETTMKQWAMPVVLRDDIAHADVIMSLPFNTYQAYNYWGGSSLDHDYTANPLAVSHASPTRMPGRLRAAASATAQSSTTCWPRRWMSSRIR